jgi:hypothetical protein
MRKGFVFFAFTLLLALCACQTKGNINSYALLAGSWVKPCVDLGNDVSVKEEWVISGGNFTRIISQSPDSQCGSNDLSMKVTGSFVVGEAVNKAQPDIKAINLTYTDFTITPKTADEASILSRMVYCGISNWTENTPVSVLEKPCGKLATGKYHFDIYKHTKGVLKGSLSFGKSSTNSDGNSLAKRPAVLDETVYIEQ